MTELGGDDPLHGSLALPDFTHEALAHLQVQSDAFVLHVQAFIQSADAQHRDQLRDDLMRFRNTLVLLEKGGAVYVAEELITLLNIDEAGELENQLELARVLLLAADQLSEHVALLQRDGSIDSALPLLPLVNDSRACRDESLLSDVVVLAAGIDLPTPLQASVDDDQWKVQRTEWVSFASSIHAQLAKTLLQWWRSSDVKTARALSRELQPVVEFCQVRNYLNVLVPLFQSAALVAEAIGVKELNDGPALRSLYAQLERQVHRCALIASPEDLLPGDLLRNYLYYVAQTESNARSAVELRQRFRLDRVRQAAQVGANQTTPTIGVGYHLAHAIRSSVATETQALRSWLDQAPASTSHPQVIRLKVRLLQLEPVLTLMGAPEALECLQQINVDLQGLKKDAIPDAETRLRLAESLVALDALLHKTARLSVTRVPANSSGVAHADAVFKDAAVDACLREARASLQQLADDLEKLLRAGPLPTGRCHTLTQRIHRIDQSLQILPLPEVSPLLEGLSDVLTRLQLSGRGAEMRDPSDAGGTTGIAHELATMLVSVDYYLGCVLQPQAAAGQLLIDAEDSLHRATSHLEGKAANMPVNLPDAEWERRVSAFLPHMDALGTALVLYRRERTQVGLDAVGESLHAFANVSLSPESPLGQLSTSASNWFDEGRHSSSSIAVHELTLLDEVHAVIPQLIDQLLSGSDSVRGFDELIERLGMRDGDLDASLSLEDMGELTLNVDDELLISPLDESAAIDLDQTMQHVFYHECLSHLEVLDESVRSALQPSADISQRLPTEQMLRALHTLTGCAQTVDAPHIIGIVQPLQRAALARQRQGASFDAEETSYIGDLVMALRVRLDSLTTGHAVGHSVKAVEQRLSSFLAASIPGANASDSGLSMASNVRSLDDVFSEEADELLERLRYLVNTSSPGSAQINDALAILHTLKGSARMAGRVPIAEHAHDIESEIQGADEPKTQHDALKAGHARLSSMLSQAVAHRTVSATRQSPDGVLNSYLHNESLLVSDVAFDSLLDLATDVTVNQARLSDELARLREVYQDIETTAIRLRELPQSQEVRNTAEVNEILADLEAARGVMRGALRQAEREQQQASRASSSLQQSLIRTRLVRVDEVLDRLSRTVKDAADSLGRQTQLRLEGGEVTLDRALFKHLMAPLEHIARNAVVHGIESAAERKSAGKSETGELVLAASIDGTDLILCFSDDGRGIKRESLNELLKARGESALNTHEDLQNALFKSGFSSVATPTALAGHGLGLSAVQAAVEQLGGQIQFATDAGSGTQLTLRIPQRIVVNQVVLVESDGVLYAMPVSYVDAVRIAGASATVPERYERCQLSSLVSQRAASKVQGAHKAAVLVSAGGVSMALQVDQVIGYREFVTQALGPQMASLQRFAGGSVMADGRQVLILDMLRLLESGNPTQVSAVRPARESLRPVALIVDDSLTMRAAAKSVLQQCGIAARLSRDGVEGLESMAAALPNLILLDLEMPRLDGAAFLKRITEEYGDACPPVIIISSRDDAENRARLLKMGAVRFLAKPYTQSQLQEAIEAAGLRIPDLTIA